jgi:hypothetical protein
MDSRIFLTLTECFDDYNYGQKDLFSFTLYGIFQIYGTNSATDEEKSSLYFYICKKKGNYFKTKENHFLYSINLFTNKHSPFLSSIFKETIRN